MYIAEDVTLAFVLLLCGVCCGVGAEDYGYYTDNYAIEIDGDQLVAELVAGTHNLKLVRHLETLGNIYQFEHEHTPVRSKRSADTFINQLLRDPNVVRVHQELTLHRVKRYPRHQREILYDKQVELDSPLSNNEAILDYYFGAGSKRGKRGCTVEENRRSLLMDFDDQYACKQWYYRNSGDVVGKAGNDVGVASVWKRFNITGRGVVVTVLDDGVDHKHPDLAPNYDPEASLDLNDEDADPAPKGTSPSQAHGTRCAGEIAAIPNDGLCGVGTAFGAKIGGIRMLDGKVTDMLEARALSHARDHVHIYSASWGPRDDGQTMEGPGELATRALRDGAKYGRGGLGSIFSWATGNGGAGDDCNCDGYVSSIYTISIGCINDLAMSTYFSEICPSTMAVIFTGGSHQPPGKDGYKHPPLSIITTDIGGKCNLDFEGTSSAAPFAAGVFALVLEANPKLTWRDMQNLLVETATIPNDEELGWTVNAAGYHINSKFGFGAMNAYLMVSKAKEWVTVAEQHSCNVTASNSPLELVKGGTITQTLQTDGCQSAQDHTSIERLEHTQLHVTIATACRGCLSVKLKSPGHTVSEMMSERSSDQFSSTFEWTYMTVHNWGENPAGTWEISITDNGNHNKQTAGQLLDWSLTLYGVVGPNPNSSPSQQANLVSKTTRKAFVADPQEIKSIMADEKKKLDSERSPVEAGSSEDTQEVSKLKDLDNLAKMMLSPDEYKSLHSILFKDKVVEKQSRPKYSNQWWKRRLEKPGGGVGEMSGYRQRGLRYNERTGDGEVQASKRQEAEEDIEKAIDLITRILNEKQLN